MAYADIAEFQRLLRIPSPTAAQTEAMERALEAAATEIDWELGYTLEAPAPDPPPPLVVEVNLDRAMEHWKQQESPGFGVVAGATADVGPTFAPRDTWYRHHLKLAPLKVSYGVA